jgi:hypothetical protein
MSEIPSNKKLIVTQNKARNTDEEFGLGKSAIGNQIRNFAPAKTRSEVRKFTCEHWEVPKGLQLIDYYVEDLAVGMDRSEFPSGLNRGPLTASIEHVLENQEHRLLKLSEIEVFVEEMSFDITTAMAVPKSGRNPDTFARRRLKPQLEAYRKLCETRKAAA